MTERKFHIGQFVTCPADRGSPAYTGKVENIGITPAKNIHGEEYVWITVRDFSGRAAVWPSNRLQ